MRHESTSYVNKATADTSNHASNAHRENAVYNLTINNAKYYEPNTENTSDTQRDIIRNT